MRKRTHSKWLVRGLPLLLVAVAFGAGAWALTASNTFANAGGSAGSGSGAISGYNVGSPTYTLDASSTKIASFVFSIDTATAGMTVKAGVVDGTFADGGCSVGTITAGAADVTCTYTSGNEPLVSAADNLTVVATS